MGEGYEGVCKNNSHRQGYGWKEKMMKIHKGIGMIVRTGKVIVDK